jgi:hypothetical protein
MNTKQIRPFIGCRNFLEAQLFYQDLGFTVQLVAPTMALVAHKNIAFYLQDAYIKDWVDNTQVFVEIENIWEFWEYLKNLQISHKHPTARLVPIQQHAWGSECFLHDPSGILWHFGQFN